MAANELILFIYNITLIPVIFFSVLFIILIFLNLAASSKNKKQAHQYTIAKLATLPHITVQVPSFNDPVAARCIEHCMKLDYPKNKFDIMIVDDSTDKNTQELLKAYATKHPDWISYHHRTNRNGFKPGALNDAMSFVKGELIVVFDADWMPKPDFLNTVAVPFTDPRVAIVQTRQDFYNKDTNIITRFAAYLLLVYHTIVMPINNRLNTVFFCGTAGALRKSAMLEVGGWNAKSITEDSELSVKLLMKGYKTVYLAYDTPSEVPDTWESFVKQQMRWCYGNARVFFDNWQAILFGKGLTLKQRTMISYITTGNIMAPIVVCMTFFGFSGWFIGTPELFHLSDILEFMLQFMYTAGFLIIGAVALAMRKKLKELPYLVLGSMTVGLVLSFSNSYAFIRAVMNKRLHWTCTPKVDNTKFVQ